MKIRFKAFLMVLALCLMLMPVTARAAENVREMGRFPNITLSPDGSERAWATDLGNKANESLPYGYTVDMQTESALEKLSEGQHYYGKQAVGSVSIGKWIVKHSPGQCIHDTPTKDTFAGFQYCNEICYSYYNNGWLAYCADCEGLIANILIYARESTVRKITSMPASSTYVYLCPHCSHLEQGTSYQHYCKAISNNRYRVTYRPNAPADSSVSGYMAPTMHMYGNSSMYNGESVSEIGYTDTALRKNSFSSTGYVFIGWNSEADGSGKWFGDGQEVLNLTAEDNGTVKLYAQWKKAEGSLLLDADGGTYKGSAVYEQKLKYGTSYILENDQIVPPAGYRVTFVTNGGNNVAPIITTKRFSYWEVQPGFAGEFKDNVYKYLGADGNVDRLKAQYMNNAFMLPDCTGNNVSLVGWYDDPGLGDDSFVGKPGDKIIVDKDTVLYAKWATLTLWAYDDYISYDGVGAVDLEWEQKDGKGKYYLLFQSEDQDTWNEIFSGNDIQSNTSISKTYGVHDQGITYTIPYTGNYTLTAYGAKGGDYDSTYLGGNGGSVAATYWFKEGDILSVYPGKSGDGLNGGTNGSGADGGSSTSEFGCGGGAASEIYLTRDGSKELLLTAGGGGGANARNTGGSGGMGGGTSTKVGADGIGAGGGGYSGGLCGEYTFHSHDDSCGYHTHTGDSKTGGACYTNKQTQSVYCGESESYFQGNCSLWWDTANNRCIRCHSTDPNTKHYGDRCKKCGKDCKEGSHYVKKTVYTLTCEVEEGWQCGKNEGVADDYKASVGGTSYASNGYGAKSIELTAGVNDGDGKVTIDSQDIGYLETTTLSDVLAKDKAIPGLIPSYVETLSGENKCRISVTPPEDYGTTYYHKVESYESDSNMKLAESNITQNTLISGISGYRFYVDTKETGTVSDGHSMIFADAVDVDMVSNVRYLHMAAVDVAGNIGPTLHIPIKALEDLPDIPPDPEYPKEVPLKTEKVLIEDTEYVYPAGEDFFYIKADGATEHTLTISGYVAGNATNSYQVDWLQMVSSAGDRSEWYQNRIPKVDISVENKLYSNMQLQTGASMEELSILLPTSAEAQRTNHAARVSVVQRFVVPADMDQMQVQVYPRALASLEDKIHFSDENDDINNQIALIPDAMAPTVTGVTELENAGNIDMTDESKDFVIQASDTGSGVSNLEVTIINQDNQMSRTYSSDTGNLIITMEKEDYLFLGDFAVTARAVDNVGNERIHESDKLAFTLKAELQRARFPYHGKFKAGDGAVLTVTTGGYADKVVIRFPDELLALNPNLNKEYVYEYPEAIKTEVYLFNIPLDTLSGSYFVEVEAWKNDRKLTEELELPINTEGSIIEEFRTRIRDNGV